MAETRKYHVAHYGDLSAVQRFIDELVNADGILIAITRHGSGGSGISVTANSRVGGYVITYFCDRVVGTWEYT